MKNYKNKYLKYKNKYLKLQQGGLKNPELYIGLTRGKLGTVLGNFTLISTLAHLFYKFSRNNKENDIYNYKNHGILSAVGASVEILGIIEMVINQKIYNYIFEEAKKQIQNSSYNTQISKFKYYYISERYNSNWTDFAIKEQKIKKLYNLRKDIIFTTEDLKHKISIPCAYYKNDNGDIADVIFYK